MDELFSIMGFMMAIILALALTVFGINAVWAWTGGPASCKAFNEHTGMHTSYDFWAGCFVTMPDGRTLPRDIARSIWEKDYKVNIEQ